MRIVAVGVPAGARAALDAAAARVRPPAHVDHVPGLDAVPVGEAAPAVVVLAVAPSGAAARAGALAARAHGGTASALVLLVPAPLDAAARALARDAGADAVLPCGAAEDDVAEVLGLAARAAAGDRAEARFRRAVEDAPFPTLLHADDGAIVGTSRSLHDLTGFTRADLPDMAHWLRCVCGPEAPAVAAEVAAFWANGVPRAAGTYTVRCKDGSSRAWEVTTLVLGGLPDGRRMAITAAYDLTDQRRAQEALRRSVEAYRRLFDDHPHPLWVFDRETFRFLAVNAAATAQYGWSREEFLARTARDVRPAREVARFEAAVRAGGGHRGPEPWVHLHRDGHELEVEVAASDVEFDGRPAALVLATDVTERRRAERALERLDRLYELLSQTNELLVRAKDRDGLLDGVCRLAVAHGGFVAAWVGLADGDGAVRVVARAGPAAAAADDMLAALVAGRGPLRPEAPVVVEDLARAPLPPDVAARAAAAGVAAAAHLPLRAAGQVVGAIHLLAGERGGFRAAEVTTLVQMAGDVSFALDTLARAQALETAAEVIESSPVALFRTGPSDGFPVDFASHNVVRWGWVADDLVARRTRFADLVHPEDRAAVAAAVASALEDGRDELVLTYRLVTATGEVRWVEDRTHVVRGPDGAAASLRCTVTDVTERHEAEATVRRHLDELRRWQAVTLDREARVQALKREVNGLARRLGEPLPYPSQAPPTAEGAP